MSTPPNAQNYPPGFIHGHYVHSELVKELENVTKSFYAMDNFAVDNKGHSVVVTSHSTFEKPAARVVSVSFENAVANIAYDDFSRGFSAPTQKVQKIDTIGLKYEEAAKAIVKEMAAIEPLFGGQVRAHQQATEENARIKQEQYARRPSFVPFD